MGVLLVNLGTPQKPDTASVRRYLGEFLSDPRVVEIPRLLWMMILYGIVLTRRPPETAGLYQSIWMEAGSPLLVYTEKQRDSLQDWLENRFKGPLRVEAAMRYGKPSIASGLLKLKQQGARRVLVLPLYPQYSGSTVGSVFDAVSAELQQWRWIPEMRFINQYHDHPAYINALAESIEEHWRTHMRKGVLLMSFHGLPHRNLLQGDPYYCQCQKTARLLADKLRLGDDQWTITFQSRFGKAQWLQPYTDKTLEGLPEQGIKHVDVICPGFAADCLETLEEINIQNRELFLEAGGESYHYIPALNQRYGHISMLADLVEQHTRGWPETDVSWNSEDIEQNAIKTQEYAKQKGARL